MTFLILPMMFRLFVEAGAADVLVGLCRLAERSASRPLLQQSLAALAKIARLLLPPPLDSPFVVDGGTASSSSSLQHAWDSNEGPDAHEMPRLRVMCLFLRVLKMARPPDPPTVTASFISREAMATSKVDDDEQDDDDDKDVFPEPLSPLSPPPLPLPPLVPAAADLAQRHALELLDFLKCQRSAVRGLAALAVHPSCRLLAVDLALPEIVALAVGGGKIRAHPSADT